MSALEKLLKGEVLTEDEKNSLTPEQIAEAEKKVKEEGIRRIQEAREAMKKEEERQHQRGVNQVEQMVKENTEKAEAFVFAKLQSYGIELTEELKSRIRDKAKRLDSGVVTYENIVQNYMDASAAINSSALFDDRRKKMDFEKSAAELNASQAAAQGSGGAGGDKDISYSQEVWDMVKQAQREGIVLTPKQAQRTLEQGLRRKFE